MDDAGGKALPDAPRVEAALRTDRERTRARAADLAEELSSIVASQASDNLDDEHDAEGSTVGFERARVSALLAAAGARLDELDGAADRMESGVYGRCQRCGRSISWERLEALPTTRTCRRCADPA